jgi:hypothetical protein
MMTEHSEVSDPVPLAKSFGEKPPDTSPTAQNPSTARIHEHLDRRHPDVDSTTGRIRPISAKEWQARQEELTRRLAEIDAEDETPEDVYDEFMRNLDDERRRQGRPTAFDGCY